KLSERTVPLLDFFVAYRRTALRTGEILKTILVPRLVARPGLRRASEWQKVSKRREMDISTVGACFCVDIDRKGIVQFARLAYGGVAAMPVRALETVSAWLGKPGSEETLAQVLPILGRDFTPRSDLRHSVEYRR